MYLTLVYYLNQKIIFFGFNRVNWPFLLGQPTDILWDYRQDWIYFFFFCGKWFDSWNQWAETNRYWWIMKSKTLGNLRIWNNRSHSQTTTYAVRGVGKVRQKCKFNVIKAFVSWVVEIACLTCKQYMHINGAEKGERGSKASKIANVFYEYFQ